MNVLIIGAAGQLGHDLRAAFSKCTLHCPGRETLDICDGEALHNFVAGELKPDLVVNAAAAHNVPACELNPELAFAVNATSARNLALACKAASARLVHVSTDYVFGEGGTRPYLESDLPRPLSVYAASKLAGEHLIASVLDDHVIVRTAALYGHAPCRAKGGRNFVGTMLHLAATRPEVKVVTDEVTTPTYSLALAKQVRLLAERGRPGLYHATCQGACSWFEFAQVIFEKTGTKTTLLPASSAEFQSPVRRPPYSVLENKFAQDQGLDIMPSWHDALEDYLTNAADA